MERYFAVLGLQSHASEQEVKEARNFVTQAFHPDKYPPGSKDQERANQKQIEINEAYQKILEHFEREKRDQALMQAGAAAGSQNVQVRSSPASGAVKSAIVVVIAKVLLVSGLAGCWGWTVWSWVGAHPAPSVRAHEHSQSAPGSTTGALAPTESRQKVSTAASALPDFQVSDLLLLLSLVLSTLAVVWFLVAPESQTLIERLVGTQR